MMLQCSLQVYAEKLKSVCTKTREVFTARLPLIVVWTPGSWVWLCLGDRMPPPQCGGRSRQELLLRGVLKRANGK